MFANDYSSRAVCRLGGEEAGERERLVTDVVNRWEVPRQASCGNAGEEAGRGGHGQKGRARPGSAELGWGPPSPPPPWQTSCREPRLLKMAKELVRWGRRWEFMWGRVSLKAWAGSVWGEGTSRAARETDPEGPKGVKCHACHARREKGRKHPQSTRAPGTAHTLSSSVRITGLGARMW